MSIEICVIRKFFANIFEENRIYLNFIFINQGLIDILFDCWKWFTFTKVILALTFNCKIRHKTR